MHQGLPEWIRVLIQNYGRNYYRRFRPVATLEITGSTNFDTDCLYLNPLFSENHRVLRQAGSPGNPRVQGFFGNQYKSGVGGIGARHRDFSIEETDLTPLGEQLNIGKPDKY